MIIRKFACALVACTGFILSAHAALADCASPEKTLKFAYVVPPDEKHPFHAAGLYFKKEMEARTDCKVAVNLFPGGQLGGDREMFEAMMIGTIDAGIISSPPVSSFTPALEGLNLPWLFDGDLEFLQKMVRGEPGQKIFARMLEDTGVRAFDTAMVPFRDIVSVRPVATNDALNGLKIRVMQSAANIATFNAIGANPTPLAFPEVYGALQTGVIDAFENDVLGVYANKLQEVTKHITRSGHFNNPAVFVMNEDLYQSLDEDMQKIVIDVMRGASDHSLVVTREQADVVEKLLVEEGVTFYDIDISALQSVMDPVYDQVTSISDVVKTFVEEVIAARDAH